MLVIAIITTLLLFIPVQVQSQQQPWPDFPFGQACKKNTCGKGNATCECYFTIEHRVTMMLETERMLLRAVNGRIHRFNETAIYSNGLPRYAPLQDLSEILTLDGYGSRLVISINRQFPGPELQAYEGQTMIIHVRNLMHTDSTTIHWHGIHQRESPWADGVAFVTQCPILPGQYYTYRFNLKQSGTYFYHAHIGDQRSMGLYGPFIVQPSTANDITNEHTVIIQDWNHDEDPETLYQRMLLGTYDLQKPERINISRSVDNTEYSRFVFHSGIINGRGRFYSDFTTHNGAPLTKFEVERNKEHRFRVISAATLYPFRVFVQNHRNLRVVASDGFNFNPVTVESFIIQPGERFDFILRMDQTAGDYLFVAESLEQGTKTYHAAEAIIRYIKSSDAEAYPDPSKADNNQCTDKDRCKVLNCPFAYYPSSTNRTCILIDNMTLDDSDFSSVRNGEINEMFFNFAFPGRNGYTPGSVNGRQFLPPVAPILSQWSDSDITSCKDAGCGENSTCECTFSVEIQNGKIYQFILSNIGNGRNWSHPVHLHGHSFYILKMGLGRYDSKNASFLRQTTDISCSTEFCNSKSWANRAWSGNNIPGLNLNSPILKDTVIVPSGGYVVIRFKADNPGSWFFHCHVDLHNTNGMGMVIDESPAQYRLKLPKGLPRCGNFEDSDYTGQKWPDFPSGQECKKNTCGKGDATCECYFTIEHRVTMMLETERMLLQAVNGRIHRYNETATNSDGTPKYTTLNDVKDILTLDGYGSRLVISINRQFPGPGIQAYEGQTMIVHVRNLMHTDSTTIHWHGIHQRQSPWADGVAFVTQCPILPGQYYTYRFNLTQSGTYFYHAHIGDQRSMGLYGPFIVQPSTANDVTNEHTVIIQDWNHDEDPETLYQRMLWGTYDFQKPEIINNSRSVDNTEFSRFVFHSGIINGKGRFYTDFTTHNGAPLTQFEVESNKEYRFRVISAATLYPFRVFVERHRNLRLVASDGFNFNPVTVESFIIQPGERFDFILRTDQTAGDYLLVAESLEQGTKTYHAAEAIIRYIKSSDAEAYPDPSKADNNQCTDKDRCKVLNCPFAYYPSSTNRTCILIDNMPLDASDFSSVRNGEINEMFFNFAFPGRNGYTPGSVNGRQFLPPVAPILSQWSDSDITSCKDAGCGENSTCECTFSVEIQNGKIYQFILSNIGNGRNWSHPVHLHGHSFYILKMGLGDYDSKTASFLRQTIDISCSTEFCNSKSWANRAWSGNTIPGLNLNSPILKDTVIVPSGGYVVIRFKADNPGPWFFHCHIDLHNTNGMGMVIDESPALYRANVQKGFPRCGNFEETDKNNGDGTGGTGGDGTGGNGVDGTGGNGGDGTGGNGGGGTVGNGGGNDGGGSDGNGGDGTDGNGGEITDNNIDSSHRHMADTWMLILLLVFLTSMYIFY